MNFIKNMEFKMREKLLLFLIYLNQEKKNRLVKIPGCIKLMNYSIIIKNFWNNSNKMITIIIITNMNNKNKNNKMVLHFNNSNNNNKYKIKILIKFKKINNIIITIIILKMIVKNKIMEVLKKLDKIWGKSILWGKKMFLPQIKIKLKMWNMKFWVFLTKDPLLKKKG